MPTYIPDVFNSDPFNSVALTGMINSLDPYLPGFLSGRGLVRQQGMLGTQAAFEEETSSVRMISATPRGSPPSQIALPSRKARVISSMHFKREAVVNADELLAGRARGLADAQTLQTLIRQKTQILRTDWALTYEHILLGLTDGVVYDADNTTILYDLFSFWGVSRPAAVNINIGAQTDTSTNWTTFSQTVRRHMAEELRNMPVGNARIIGLAGDGFFDALITSKEFAAARRNGAMGNQAAAERIADTTMFAAVDWAGVTWVNYKGDAGSLVAVPAQEARLFPEGVPDLFQMWYAPADLFESVEAEGLPLYLFNLPSRRTERQMAIELQTNPLPMCMRPRALLRVTKS